MKDKCSKCGSELISTRYSVASNRLKKTCGRCEYFWYEPPEDYKDQPAKEQDA